MPRSPTFSGVVDAYGPDARERRAGRRHTRRHARGGSGSSSRASPSSLFCLRSLRRGRRPPLFLNPRARPPGNRRGDHVRRLARDPLAGVSTARSAGRPSGSGARRSAPRVAIGPLVGGALTTWLRLAVDLLRQRADRDPLHPCRPPRSARVRGTRVTAAWTSSDFVTLTGGLFLPRARGCCAATPGGWSSGLAVTLYVVAALLLVGFLLHRGAFQREPMLDFSLFPRADIHRRANRRLSRSHPRCSRSSST